MVFAIYLRDVARRKEGLSGTGDVSPDGDSTLSIGRRGEGAGGPRLRHLVDLLVLLTFSTIQFVTMSQPWGPWILAWQETHTSHDVTNMGSPR